MPTEDYLRIANSGSASTRTLSNCAVLLQPASAGTDMPTLNWLQYIGPCQTRPGHGVPSSSPQLVPLYRICGSGEDLCSPSEALRDWH